MLLDRNGDLVQPPRQSERTGSNSGLEALIALDPRVGANIRLGDDPAALPSTMRAQAEPHIARSAVDPDFLVAVFQEGRFPGPGAVDCGYAVSHNGGLTWSRALIPQLTMAGGGPYFRATDPVAGVSSNGNIYLNTLVSVDDHFGHSAVVISRSTDGGASFEAPRVVYDPGTSTTAFPDKNWMAVNTFPATATAGRVVVTFSLFPDPNADGAPILRSFSDDGGITWSLAANITPASPLSQGSQPVFLPDGKMAVVYWNFVSSTGAGQRIEVVISNDGGLSFGPPVRVTNVDAYGEARIRSGTFLPSATGDRTTGSLYVVYQARFGGAPRILFTKSTNGGVSWSAPIAISDNPSTSGVFNPAIAASPNGQTLTVAFYDHRDNPGSDVLVDMYLAQSFDGGATWQPNIRLTSVSTDASLAPIAGLYMLGDYLGIAEPTNANVPAVPVWVDTRTGDPDPFVTRIGIAPQVNFISWQAARLSLAQINQPGVGGLDGDADHDGEDNSSEFQSLTDPNDPNSVVRSARDLNISTRARVASGEHDMIAGFIITGSDQKKVLIRTRGPSLTSPGIPAPLQDPILDLRDMNGALLVSNDNWKDSTDDIAGTGLAPKDDREPALLQTLMPGAYTAVTRAKGADTGLALVEVYDLGPTANSKLANLSTRGFVEIGDNVMIGGFIVGGGLGTNGNGTAKVVVRGLGPTLAQFRIHEPLQDPMIELRGANGAIILANDNWRDSQLTELQMTGLAPTDNRESALLAVLAKGNYTVVMSGKSNGIGVGLVEVYNIQ